MRLFLAIEPDAPTRTSISTAIDQIRSSAGDLSSAFKWTAAANLHITLHFLGELPASRLPELRAALAGPIDVPPFAAVTAALGTFPGHGPPRVIWLSVGDGTEGMRRIHAGLRRRMAPVSISLDDRAFVPHFTLARTRDRDRRRARSIESVLVGLAPPVSRWLVDRVTLFESRLGSGPPRYEVVAHLPLE